MSLQQDLQSLCDAYVAAYRVADSRGCAAVFTEDAVLHSAFAPPAQGRAAIATLHEEWTAVGGGDKTLTVVQSDGAGDVAWFAADFAEGHQTGEGHSLCVCRRSPGGPWRIRICSLTAA